MKLYHLLTNGYEYNNFYELLFSNYLSNDTPEIYEYTGVVPYTFTANGADLLDWYIKGNAGGVGDRTGNLFDEIYTNIVSDTPRYKPIYVGNGTFTLSTNTPLYASSAVLFFIAGNVASGAATTTNGVSVGNSRTVTAIDGYVTIAYRYYTGADPRDYQTMLNTGLTPLPYEPYGYKIPVICGDETTNIYIDAPLDASDMITMSDVNVSIPTVQGSNTISVDTTVQPSEIYIKYIGG